MHIVIAIVGMCGSGKSVVTEYLEKDGWKKVYFGGQILRVLEERGLDTTPENEKAVREELRRQYGQAAHAIKLLPLIQELLKTSDVVIDGLYSWSEYKYLKAHLNEKLTVVCVLSNKSDRYSRLSNRKFRPLLPAEAENRDYAEIESLEKGGPIAIADYYLLNSSTIEHLKTATLQLSTTLRELKST